MQDYLTPSQKRMKWLRFPRTLQNKPLSERAYVCSIQKKCSRTHITNLCSKFKMCLGFRIRKQNERPGQLGAQYGSKNSCVSRCPLEILGKYVAWRSYSKKRVCIRARVKDLVLIRRVRIRFRPVRPEFRQKIRSKSGQNLCWNQAHWTELLPNPNPEPFLDDNQNPNMRQKTKEYIKTLKIHLLRLRK